MHLTGNIYDYFIVFAGGVLVSFTPCVYPVLPLTVAFIAGANINGSKFRGFLISLVYVFGMSITYCSLAVFAALTGKIFGQLQASAGFYVVISGMLIFLSLAMFDVINLPILGLSAQQKEKPKNLLGVLLSGIVSGLMIGACTAPVLGALLVYVASSENVIHGVSLVFVFSYGVGFSLILVGTFSGILSNLPKSGYWLKRIKYICASVIMLAAIYFLYKVGTDTF